MNTLSWVDYILFSIVLGVSCILGIYFGCFGNRQETKNDYLLGGRQMSVIPVAASLIASTLSASSLLGIPTEIYLYGTQYWMMGLSVLIAGLCTNYLFLPVYYKLGLTTLYEYLEIRFDIYVRRMASFIYVVDCLTLMPCMIYAPSLALSQMSGFDLHFIAIILSVVCIFYTALGGLRGVVWTNTIQFCVTACTLCIVIVMGTLAVGGWSQIWEKGNLGKRIEFFNINPDPTQRGTLWTVVIGNTFVWLNYTATNPAAIQRLLAVPNLTDSRKTLSTYIVGTIIAKSLCCYAGLIMFAKYFSCDPLSAGYIQRPDQIFPYYVLDVASNTPGISGLFIAATFSSALSSLSTLINTLSGTIYIDFIERFMPIKTTERVASNTIRGISVIIGLITFGLVFVIEQLGTILQLMVSFSGIVAGPAVGICTLGMLFPVANAKGVLSGAITAILVMWYVAVGSYITNVDTSIDYLPKPLYTQSCNLTTVLDTFTETSNTTRTEPLWLYKVSFHYYGLMGAAITVLVGLLVSFITGHQRRKPVHLDLLSPILHWLVGKQCKNQETGVDVADVQKDVTSPFLPESLNS